MRSTPLLKVCTLFFCILCFHSCSKEEEGTHYTKSIKGLTADNFPYMDSSTSTHPLMNIVAYRLMGIPYYWQVSPINGIEKHIAVDYQKVNNREELNKISEKLNSSTTHGSFINLIDQKAELIIASRSISRDEKQYAEEKRSN
ncbi:MAG: hypothetical protein LUE93_13510 [Bacteroides sp.]|nr:hypothetical protein [Bacteroides sp.]